jgi:hypothetical protein
MEIFFPVMLIGIRFISTAKSHLNDTVAWHSRKNFQSISAVTVSIDTLSAIDIKKPKRIEVYD